MGDTIQSLIANVIQSLGFTNGDEHVIAREILDQPEIQAIIDLAAYYRDEPFGRLVSPEVQALLESWRGSRAERPSLVFGV